MMFKARSFFLRKRLREMRAIQAELFFFQLGEEPAGLEQIQGGVQDGIQAPARRQRRRRQTQVPYSPDS